MSTHWIRTEPLFDDRMELTSIEVPDGGGDEVSIRRGLLERLLGEAGYVPGPPLP